MCDFGKGKVGEGGPKNGMIQSPFQPWMLTLTASHDMMPEKFKIYINTCNESKS